MRLSAYFDSSEFDCHDGTEVPDELMGNLVRLGEALTYIRLNAGVPLAVISGYRTKAWNDRVGGVDDSAHMTAEAADVRPGRGMTPAELHTLILAHHKAGRLPLIGGLGLYKTWVHVDVRKAADGHLRRWTGKGIGSEQ